MCLYTPIHAYIYALLRALIFRNVLPEAQISDYLLVHPKCARCNGYCTAPACWPSCQHCTTGAAQGQAHPDGGLRGRWEGANTMQQPISHLTSPARNTNSHRNKFKADWLIRFATHFVYQVQFDLQGKHNKQCPKPCLRHKDIHLQAQCNNHSKHHLGCKP